VRRENEKNPPIVDRKLQIVNRRWGGAPLLGGAPRCDGEDNVARRTLGQEAVYTN
jgi:hypothetical protein